MKKLDTSIELLGLGFPAEVFPKVAIAAAQTVKQRNQILMYQDRRFSIEKPRERKREIPKGRERKKVWEFKSREGNEEAYLGTKNKQGTVLICES